MTRHLAFVLVILAGSLAGAQTAEEPKLLSWDAPAKKAICKQGDTAARFTFFVTNVSTHALVITGAQTTCECTSAKVPAQPWILAPAASGQLQVSMELSNRVGTVKNAVFILGSNVPLQTLTVEAAVAIRIPKPKVSAGPR